MPKKVRMEGRYVTAQDVSDRLMPDLDVNEVLLWPPDLFAYTSYLMTKTSAYQLVVSPPTGKSWPPKTKELREWLFTDPPTPMKAESKWDYWAKYGLKEWSSDNKFPVEKKIGEIKNRISCSGEWKNWVQKVGSKWRRALGKLKEEDFQVIDLNSSENLKRDTRGRKKIKDLLRERHGKLLEIVFKATPPEVLACWAFFYREVMRKNFHNNSRLRISELLCNQDEIQTNAAHCERLWKVSQVLLTMHAISDTASVRFDITDSDSENDLATKFARELLFGRDKGFFTDTKFNSGGSFSTFHTDRVRVLPKRHNPNVGITLRSISSNLAFNQSSVDVVWRKTVDNPLGNRLMPPKTIKKEDKENFGKGIKMSMLILPFPLIVKTNDFRIDSESKNVKMNDDYGFFTYDPDHTFQERHKEIASSREVLKALKLIRRANEELAGEAQTDMVIFPEAALSVTQFNGLQTALLNPLNSFEKLKGVYTTPPSIIVAGVRESRDDLKKEREKVNQDTEVTFPRNAVYCQYYDAKKHSYFVEADPKDNDTPTNINKSYRTPKFKQYKHHRWQLNERQVKRYGLTSVLDPKKIWWESIKIPKRRVSFLNVGKVITISHLICEDLARLDPISELIRHVGPTLVIAILMDGPQVRSRWSARYATVLADDPGSSVITLTSIGMVNRDHSPYGSLSRVVALWNESHSTETREIELAPGAEAVLLNLEIDKRSERTADGRKETAPTAILKLVDVIQIYPD